MKELEHGSTCMLDSPSVIQARGGQHVTQESWAKMLCCLNTSKLSKEKHKIWEENTCLHQNQGEGIVHFVWKNKRLHQNLREFKKTCFHPSRVLRYFWPKVGKTRGLTQRHATPRFRNLALTNKFFHVKGYIHSPGPDASTHGWHLLPTASASNFSCLWEIFLLFSRSLVFSSVWQANTIANLLFHLGEKWGGCANLDGFWNLELMDKGCP